MRAALWLGLLAAATPASLALPSAMDAALRPSTALFTHKESDSGRTNLPSGKGCHELRDLGECCRSTDGRKDFAWQPCLPTTQANANGNVCEPASCFTGLGVALDAPLADCASILSGKGVEEAQEPEKVLAEAEAEKQAPHEALAGPTLVILIGEARGGPNTWSTLFQHVLEPFSADLALVFGTKSVAPELTTRAKYIWMFEDATTDEEWHARIDAIARSLGKQDVVFENQLSSVSSKIVLYMRWWLVQHHTEEMRGYSTLVLTRSDQFYLCTPLLWPPGTMEVLVAQGEDYGGVNDRFIVLRSEHVAAAVDFLGGALRSLPDGCNLGAACSGVENVEQIQKANLENANLAISRFPRTMVTVALDTDKYTSPFGDPYRAAFPEGEQFGLHLRYSAEYPDATSSCGSRQGGLRAALAPDRAPSHQERAVLWKRKYVDALPVEERKPYLRSTRFLGRTRADDPGKSHSSSSATSGERFSGETYRQFTGPRKFEPPMTSTTKTVSAAAGASCDNWAVVTTIFEPTEAVAAVAQMDGWCLVVAGDTSGPSTYDLPASTNSATVIYLTPDMQEAQNMSLADVLPWHSFSRKNMGYLYAISAGAKIIYDFDDDNGLVPGCLQPNTDLTAHQVVSTTQPVYNLYPQSGGGTSWPRGFPLDRITDARTYNASFAPVKNASVPPVGVLQSLVNGDPDLDSIYRMTYRETGFDFAASGSEGNRMACGAAALALPKGTFMPYNAQATIHDYDAFWGLLLPHAIHGRVADIWRSYVAQAILPQVGRSVAFGGPWAVQERNSHDYLADFSAEDQLFKQASELVRVLHEWSPQSHSLPGRLEELHIELYERGFLEESDVLAAQAFLADLTALGYRFPELKNVATAAAPVDAAATAAADTDVSGPRIIAKRSEPAGTETPTLAEEAPPAKRDPPRPTCCDS